MENSEILMERSGLNMHLLHLIDAIPFRNDKKYSLFYRKDNYWIMFKFLLSNCLAVYQNTKKLISKYLCCVLFQDMPSIGLA